MPGTGSVKVDGPEGTESSKSKSTTRFCQEDAVYRQKQEDGQMSSMGCVERVKQRNVLATMQAEGSVTSACECRGQAL